MQRQRPSDIWRRMGRQLTVLAQPLRDEAFEVALRHRDHAQHRRLAHQPLEAAARHQHVRQAGG